MRGKKASTERRAYTYLLVIFGINSSGISQPLARAFLEEMGDKL
jgi:hypothetical protein